MAFTYTRKNPYEDEYVKKYAQEKVALDAAKPADWTGGTYGQSIKDTLAKLDNREKFTYDLNGDMLYNQYKDQYINAGKMAMADTMGQAAALTGGYGNSYAATVGNQAYQSYLQQLNNKVPELYQLALNRYNQEGQDLNDALARYQSLYNTEYAENQDLYNRWNADRSRNDSLYSAALDRATNEANTNYNNAFNLYQQQVSEDQWNKNYELQKQSAARSAAAANQSAKIAALEGELKYRDALDALGDGIKTIKQLDTKNHKSYTGYTVMGKAYKTRAEAENAVAEYLDKIGIKDADYIKAIYKQLGIGTK